MRMRIAIRLPRTDESVSVARRIIDRILGAFGVVAECRAEIALVVTEACSNAVRHADRREVYELRAESDDNSCVIQVDDFGPEGAVAVPAAERGGSALAMPGPEATSGRGLALIRLLTDRLEFRSRSGGGLSVRMVMPLRWSDGAIGIVPT
jgi:serine/threonine-protein kinase RsbW